MLFHHSHPALPSLPLVRVLNLLPSCSKPVRIRRRLCIHYPFHSPRSVSFVSLCFAPCIVAGARGLERPARGWAASLLIAGRTREHQITRTLRECDGCEVQSPPRIRRLEACEIDSRTGGRKGRGPRGSSGSTKVGCVYALVVRIVACMRYSGAPRSEYEC